MQAILILSPLLGTSRTQGLRSIPAPLWAPEKAGVRQPILILSPLNPLKQKYHLPSPPVATFFAPTSAPPSDQRDEKAISSHICRGKEPPPPPSSWPPNPPTRPPPPHPESGTEVGVWPAAATPPVGRPHGKAHQAFTRHTIQHPRWEELGCGSLQTFTSFTRDLTNLFLSMISFSVSLKISKYHLCECTETKRSWIMKTGELLTDRRPY